MYCGDETGAFIGDVGSHTSRFGYGGEDNPKYVVPSYVSKGSNGVMTIPSSCYQAREHTVPIYRMAQSANSEEPQVDPNAYLQQGDIIENWDAFEHIWQSSFDVLRVRDSFKHTTGSNSETVQSSSAAGEGKCAHPLLAIDSGCTHVGDNSEDAHRKQRMKMTEIMMESLDASAIFIAPTPMLAAFSYGRQTGMVVDVGAGGCRVTPVVDGLLLKNAQRRNGRGGDWLGNVQWQALLNDKVPLQPRYRLRSSSKCDSGAAFHRWAMQDLMYEFRSSEHVSMPQYRLDLTTPFVYDDKDDDSMQLDVTPSTYELPDGTTIDLTTRTSKDLCRLPELLYTDNVPFVNEDTTSSLSTLSNLPLHKLVHASLTAVGDADARKELCGNIILTGGSSLLPNMEQRLSYELTTVVPSMYKCRVLASRNSTERACAAWIGASVLTSLGSFQQLWLSRAEYEEFGAALAIQRYP